MKDTETHWGLKNVGEVSGQQTHNGLGNRDPSGRPSGSSRPGLGWGAPVLVKGFRHPGRQWGATVDSKLRGDTH